MTAALGHAPALWRRAAVLVVASMALWPLAPLLATHWPLTRSSCQLLDKWFELQCERDPARSLHLFGTQLGVCARCSGIYWGLGFGALLGWPRLGAKSLRLWVLSAALLMLLDIELEARALHGAWPTARVLSGVLLGLPVGAGLSRVLLGLAEAAHKP